MIVYLIIILWFKNVKIITEFLDLFISIKVCLNFLKLIFLKLDALVFSF